MPAPVPATGPRDARIMIVGEAPGADEELRRQPFVGSSGQELTRALAEANIIRDDCFITNVCKERPPNNDIKKFFLTKTQARKEHVEEFLNRYPREEIRRGIRELEAEIEEVSPEVIIALGDTALWALTGEEGITKWRGSYLRKGSATVLPTYHPAAILRMWAWRAVMVHDLRRARRALDTPPQVPQYRFLIRPDLPTVINSLRRLLSYCAASPITLACDIETRAGHITCFGLAWSNLDALCIPFTHSLNRAGYWTPEDEFAIISLLKELLTHKNAQVLGQMFSYDMQYIARHWGFIPHFTNDTMIAQAVAFPGTPKSLDYLSSLYCNYHRYWKDEGRMWDPLTDDEEQYWVYNCKDCCATYEVNTVLKEVLYSRELYTQYVEQIEIARVALKMMLRGVRIDVEKKNKLVMDLSIAMLNISRELEYILGYPLNPRSTKQMKALFYDRFGCSPIRNRKTGSVTLAADALDTIKKKCDPLLYPIIDKIKLFRQLGVFNSTFAQAKLDADQRIRCSYSLVETMRFASREDAFGFGTNLQNIPKGEEA